MMEADSEENVQEKAEQLVRNPEAGFLAQDWDVLSAQGVVRFLKITSDNREQNITK